MPRWESCTTPAEAISRPAWPQLPLHHRQVCSLSMPFTATIVAFCAPCRHRHTQWLWPKLCVTAGTTRRERAYRGGAPRTHLNDLPARGYSALDMAGAVCAADLLSSSVRDRRACSCASSRSLPQALGLRPAFADLVLTDILPLSTCYLPPAPQAPSRVESISFLDDSVERRGRITSGMVQ